MIPSNCFLKPLFEIPVKSPAWRVSDYRHAGLQS